jgi:16S rRNA (cytosine967-C5)-methyltransferase
MKKADYHVVNEIVDYAKHEKGKAQANFVNAILRRYLREKGGRSGIPEGALEHSFPRWLIKRWEDRYGKTDTDKLLTLLNESPRFTLRVNLARISISEAASRLRKEGIKTEEGMLSESALSVEKLGPVLKSTLFREGLISIQDEMSQLVGAAIGVQTNKRILDACAGLGTKTRQIKEICPDSLVVSMDNEIRRLKSITGTGTAVLGDATRSPFMKGVFDIILIDAPCSSLGIIGKHPEIKWRRCQQDIISFGNFQLSLLNALWDNLAEGGHLVYSVCSFEPEETTEVIAKFRKDRQFRLENPLPFLFNKEYFLSVPHHTGSDGFFIAKMKKI